MISKPILKCRLCGNKEIYTILELGDQPPANSLRELFSEELENVPLIICRCNKCTTIQLTQTINPEYLFRNYVWRLHYFINGSNHKSCFKVLSYV